MRIAVGLTAAALIAAAAAYAISYRNTAPLQATRVPVEHMQINTLAQSAAGLVAGGELGHLLISTDGGNRWSDARVNVQRQALINQIVFSTNKVGIAVGHEGWILRTEDGGESWQEVAFDTKKGEPLMSVACVGAGKWIAVGAFGRALRSDDDGKTWQRFAIAGISDHHLNRIVGAADHQHWIITGEQGLVLMSSDSGTNWNIVPPFYDGSFYGAVSLGGANWLVYGMRGNVFRSTDDGSHWEKSVLPAPISTFGDARTAQGDLLLVGQNGTILDSTDNGAHFTAVKQGTRVTLIDIMHRAQGWLVASDNGLRAYTDNLQESPAPTGTAQLNSGAFQ